MLTSYYLVCSLHLIQPAGGTGHNSALILISLVNVYSGQNLCLIVDEQSHFLDNKDRHVIHLPNNGCIQNIIAFLLLYEYQTKVEQETLIATMDLFLYMSCQVLGFGPRKLVQ